MAAQTAQTARGSPGARSRDAVQREYVAYVLLALGLAGIAVAMVVGIIRADTAADVFAFDKATRDGAAAGSSLLADQGRLGALGAWLAPFVFLSLTGLITGIALAFWAILLEVRRRGEAARAMMLSVRARSS